MSGRIAEALLGGASKKFPMLSPPKIKKESKSYTFVLKLAESNDRTYPEISWTELVRNAEQKEIDINAASGGPVLDALESDDEEDLRAVAAKFEAKYKTTPPAKKKRRVEDYVDRGSGYDESDPFIDNSDVYDEVVPEDLQTVHGGFYINSGSLEFKEVENSEDEDANFTQIPELSKPKKGRKAQEKSPGTTCQNRK